ncbi:MAG: DUF6603 domain-containing protein, partial [Bacteroidota bacterium]
VEDNDTLKSIQEIVNFGKSLKDYFSAMDKLSSDIKTQITPGNIANSVDRDLAEDFVKKLAKRVFDLAFFGLMEKNTPFTLFILKMVGLIEWQLEEANNNDELSTDYVKKVVRFDRIKDLITDPAKHFQNSFNWGTNDFDPTDFFQIYSEFFDEEADIVIDVDNGDPFMAIGNFIARKTSDLNPAGLELLFKIMLEASVEKTYPFLDNWGITFLSKIGLEGEVGLKVAPLLNFELIPPSGEVKGEVRLFISREESAQPVNIIVNNDFVNFTIQNIKWGTGITVVLDPIEGKMTFDPLIFGEMERAVIKIGSDNADGFVAKLLSNINIEGVFDLGLEWTAKLGLKIKASGGIEITLPIHKSLGPVEIKTIFLALGIKENGTLAFEASAGMGAKLGPFSMVLERIGSKMDLNFSEGSDANFGVFDLDLDFKPPNGVGLDLDAGAVRGGGYIFFDPDKGEYAGVAELTVIELVSVKAIAIINTKNPDGTKGFSFLLLITAEFTPIQLGFGFTLNGVGGLVGINRSISSSALLQGVRDNTTDSVLFPEDPVANAPMIIASLNKFFPISQKTYAFGFMGILGWGTPSLITLEMGFMFTFPEPLSFIILGELKMVLPDEKAPIINFQVNFLGEINFTEKYMFFFASIYNSRIALWSVSGEMYFSIDWGNNANFVFSVGGFHPDYIPPNLRGGISQLKRITLNLLGGNNPRLTLTFYFAVTSNTVQFGAAADFMAKAWKIRVVGYLYFDALFQFNPFYFKISIGAGLAVMWGSRELFGIHLSGSLEGPSPWRIKGKATFKILFVKVKVRVDKTFGKREDTTLPPKPILPFLLEPLQDKRNWVASRPTAKSLLVSMRKLESEDLIAHPFSVIGVSQNRIPLNIDLDKVGSNQPADFTKFKFRMDLSEDVSDETNPITDFFAPAEYIELSNADKLSRKSFEKFNAGIKAQGQDGFATGEEKVDNKLMGDYVEKELRHETCIIDNPEEPEEERGRVFENQDNLAIQLQGNAVARSVLGRAHTLKNGVIQNRFVVTEELYQIVNTASLSKLTKGGEAMTFTTETQAKNLLKQMEKKQPQLRGLFQVISTSEID